MDLLGFNDINNTPYLFEINTHLCDCTFNNTSKDPKNPYYEMTITALPKCAIYGYHRIFGLSRINHKDKKILNKYNPVKDLLSLSLSNNEKGIQAVIEYFKKYGLLFPMRSNDILNVSYYTICDIIRNIKHVYLLYKYIFLKYPVSENELYKTVITLNTSAQTIIKLNEKELFTSYLHKFAKYIFVSDELDSPDYHSDDSLWMPYDHDYYIDRDENRFYFDPDTHKKVIIPKEMKIYDYYLDKEIKFTGYNFPYKRIGELSNKHIKKAYKDKAQEKIFDAFLNKKVYQNKSYNTDISLDECHTYYDRFIFLYFNVPKENTALRYFVDFFFHMIPYSKKDLTFDLNKLYMSVLEDVLNIDINQNPLDARKQFLLQEIAKETLKSELNYWFKAIRLVPNINNKEINMRIPNLFTAILFSIYYFRKKDKVIKKCLCPDCNNTFEVEKGKLKQIYCSTKCKNKMAKRAERARKATKINTDTISDNENKIQTK